MKMKIVLKRKEILTTTEELEASALMERLTSPVIDLKTPDRSKGYSHHFLPGTSELTPMTISTVLNEQLPKAWRSHISKVVWK
jgi:hypothetical protein